VHVVDESGGDSPGFYEIDPAIPDADGGKALITGIPLNLREIVQPTTTLDDKRVLYIFGSAWNELTVSGLLLLGTKDSKGAQLGALTKWYEENRVSVLRGPIKLSLGTVGVDAFVVGMGLSEANPAVNTQAFTINLMTADSAS